MTQVEAVKIVEMLKNGCVWHRFDEPGVYEAYVRSLIKYDYRQMATAVDVVLENDSKNVPPISALAKVCRENKPNPDQVVNAERCDICNDKGYVLMTEVDKLTENLSIPREYVLHCVCPVGMAQAYNGRECKDPEHRSPYIVPSVTRYFDDRALDEIKKTNRVKARPMSQTEIQVLRAKFLEFGVRMPDLKPHEIEHGDAWEGDEPCPF
jgi:hypothetical protein